MFMSTDAFCLIYVLGQPVYGVKCLTCPNLSVALCFEPNFARHYKFRLTKVCMRRTLQFGCGTIDLFAQFVCGLLEILTSRCVAV